MGIGIYIGNMVGRSSGSSWTPQSEYLTVKAAMISEPSLADQKIQDTWLKAMKEGGYLAKAELLNMLSVDVAANSLLNWKNPGTFNPSSVGAPVFFPYMGYLGSTNNALRLNFIPSSDGTLISQNNTCVIIGLGDNVLGSVEDFGAKKADSTGYLGIRTRYTGDLTYSRCNDNHAASAANTDSIKYFAVSRGAANNYDLYLNKVKTNMVQNSDGFSNVELYALGFNFNGTITYSTRRLRFIFVFSYLTEAEVDDVIDITEAYLNNYKTGLLNYNQYIASAAVASKADLALTTYDGSNETIHPSVVNIGAVWNGYQYWMANTPLPFVSGTTYDTTKENPSIWASADGITWVVPAGLTNPVIAYPGVGLTNADTDLFYNSADNKLYMTFKRTGGLIKMTSSADGVTWSAPVDVLTTIAGEGENISQSLIKIGSRFYLYYFTADSFAPTVNGRILRVSCDTIDGTYGTREAVNLPVSLDRNSAVVNEYWHFSITNIAGVYWLSAAARTISTSSIKELFIMKSSDGINFTKSTYPTLTNNGLTADAKGYYRPSLMLVGAQPTLYYGRYTSTSLSKTAKVNVTLY